MKEKLRKTLLKFLIVSISLTPIIALADSPTVVSPTEGTNAGRGNQFTYGNCYTDESYMGVCWTFATSGNASRLYGVRASLVDSNGNRVGGTRSIDLIGGTSLAPSTVAEFDPFVVLHDVVTRPWNGYENYEGKKITVMKISDDYKGNKNEFINKRNQVGLDGLGQYVTTVNSFSEIQTYKWSALTNFVANKINIKTPISKMYYQDFNSIKKILSLMGYNLNDLPTNIGDYHDYYERIKDYYLLVEPLVYVQHQFGPASEGRTRDIVYGTVTEVTYILNYYYKYNIGSSDAVLATYAQSILVQQAVRDGQLQDWTAGLHATTANNSKEATLKEVVETDNGMAAAHFWLRGDCSDPCACGQVCDSEPEAGSCAINGLKINTAVCFENQSGQVSDTDDWACIYRQANASKTSYEGQFYVDLNQKIGVSSDGSDILKTNPYCNIACRETISYVLPSSVDERFTAGYRFAVGLNYEDVSIPVLSPITFTGTKECSTALKPSYLDSLGSTSLNRTSTQTGVSDQTIMNNSVIDKDKFVREYTAANNNVIAKWDEYQIALLPSRAAAAANEKKTNNEGGSTGGSTTCSADDSWSITGHAYYLTGSGGKGSFWKHFDPNITCTTSSTDPVCTTTANGGTYSTIDANARTYNEYTGNRGSSSHTITSYSATASYTKYNGQTVTSGQKTATKASCGNPSHGSNASETEAEKSAREAAKQAYDDAVAQRDLLLKYIEQCNNYVDDYNEFDPSVNFGYKNLQYNAFFKLDKAQESNTSSIQYTRKNGSTYSIYGTTATSYIDSAKCEGNSACVSGYEVDRYGQVIKNERVQYQINDKITSTKNITYNYYLGSNNAYKYHTIDGRVFETEEAAGATNISYTTYGYNSLPISFDTGLGETCKEWFTTRGITKADSNVLGSGGVASDMIEYMMDFYYDIDGEVSIFGKNQKYTKYRDTILKDSQKPFVDMKSEFLGNSSTVGGQTFAYVCDKDGIQNKGINPYEVQNCIFGCCNPPCYKTECTRTGGINIIYRPISLFNPFPSIKGTGREPGANWSGYLNSGDDLISVKERYITNNRGVKTNEVYTLTPMYEFTLNPYNIGQIRAYNDKQKNNYNDFETLKCTNNTHCLSTFLSTGKQEGYFGFTSNLGGTCMNNNQGWEDCR